ncbi:elongation factor 4 [Rickettsiales bacterium (ex Bugula neritina AB1)]|nr:elongation factor 4 [Rickettsiales bacterium (ex Bugula neritina AB1)]
MKDSNKLNKSINSSSIPTENIRNFTIIAHIDHGKSTLSDRIIEICGGISKREMKDRVLDSMDLEKEKGITIKAQTICLNTEYNKKNYQLNLVDTPGHVDFNNEVKKTSRACEISLLLIDATKGIEAQTVSNFYNALELGHQIIPVINKIDSPLANIEKCIEELDNVFSLQKYYLISAKNGTGVEEVLIDIINNGPPPENNNHKPLRILIFDSWYDNYLGVIVLIRIKDGILKKNQNLKTKQTNITISSTKFGYKKNLLEETSILNSGEIGYLVTGIKNPSLIKIGDTLVEEEIAESVKALPGFENTLPVVFSSIYPTDQNNYESALKCLEKLYLSDSSFVFEKEKSHIFGMGFRCGFLGSLHMEILQERLIREFNLEFIPTIPNVTYEVFLKNKEMILIKNANELPKPDKIDYIKEPWVKLTIFTPQEYVGPLKVLTFARRSEYISESFVKDKILIDFIIPLGEIIVDFQDKIKSISKGYASYTYEFDTFKVSKILKLDFYVNNEIIPELATLVEANKVESVARNRCLALKENLDRQQVEIRIQAALNGKIIASEKISPYAKNMLAKCSGGDITRKMKLLKKQKEGKKKMLNISSIDLKPSIFAKILKF